MEIFGLDAQTEVLYRALLQHDDWDVNQLAKHLGEDEETVEHGLRRLAELSLARRDRGENTRWILINPRLGLATLLARQEAALARYQQRVHESRRTTMTFLAQLETTSTENLDVQRLEGPEEIRLQVEQFIRRASCDVVSFAPGGSRLTDVLENDPELVEAALTRGVRLRALYQSSTDNSAAERVRKRWLVGLGGEIRTTPVLPFDMMIVDCAVAMLPLDPERPSGGAAIISLPGLAAALSRLFEQEWAAGTPFGTPYRRDDMGLTKQERHLLKLLHEGLTDEGAARRLGVSLRTVRRIMSDLMGRSHVRSRFQLGTLAGERGWLDDQSPAGGAPPGEPICTPGGDAPAPQSAGLDGSRTVLSPLSPGTPGCLRLGATYRVRAATLPGAAVRS